MKPYSADPWWEAFWGSHMCWNRENCGRHTDLYKLGKRPYTPRTWQQLYREGKEAMPAHHWYEQAVIADRAMWSRRDSPPSRYEVGLSLGGKVLWPWEVKAWDGKPDYWQKVSGSAGHAKAA